MATEYHHFIPQLILRKFSNLETLVAEGVPRKKAKKYCKVSFLSLEDGTLESRLAARTFGKSNMYLDPSIFQASASVRCAVEEELAALEDRTAKILHNIESAHSRGDCQFTLTRRDKNELRRFLFIMLYRNRTFEQRFETSKPDYNADDKDFMLNYMQQKGIEDPKTVWLNNLRVFLRVPLETDLWTNRDLIENAYPPDAEGFVFHMESTFLSFCCPGNLTNSNSDFILTQDAYSIFEGPNDDSQWTDWHVFAPISPVLMIVMRKNLLQEREDQEQERIRLKQLGLVTTMLGLDGVEPQRLSNLMHLPLERPKVKYAELSNHGDSTAQYSKADEFIFKFIHLDTEQVQAINTIFFEEAIWTSGIVFNFNNRQSIREHLEHYLMADPAKFKKTYTNDQALKVNVQQPLSGARHNAWKMANFGTYLQILEKAAASLGSDVKALYLDHNCFSYMDGVCPHFIRRYSILGGDGYQILYDLAQANSITNLVTRVDVLIQRQPQSFKTHVRQERTKLLEQLPTRRIWLHIRQLRSRIMDNTNEKPEQELINCVKSQSDGPEDALIDAYHVFDKTRFAEILYRFWDLQLFLHLNPKFGTGWKGLRDGGRARLAEEHEVVYGRPGLVMTCGIPKLEREAERLFPICEQQAAFETHTSSVDAYMMRLELLLRRSLYERLDSILEPDLSSEQISSLRHSFFDNYFRLSIRNGHSMQNR